MNDHDAENGGWEGGDDERLGRLAAELRAADTAGVLTGAGVSTASGIPDFRGEEGVWREAFDPADFEIRRFEADPAGFWKDRMALYDAMFPDGVAPNPAHEAIADLEHAGHLEAVVTQNTDGLHAAAGSDSVIELHGSVDRVVCRDCGRLMAADPIHDRVRDGDLPPTCGACGGVYKPDVVLFGERLPRVALAKARDLGERSDVFLSVGSSLTVEPAASLPRLAGRDGTVAVVNLSETPYDRGAEYVFRADVTSVLPRLADLLTDG